MAKIKNYIMYVDMDGVVADFDGALLDRFGFRMNDVHKGKVWGKIKHYNDTVEPWFYSLPMMDDAQQLWDFLQANFEHVEMLTATGSTPRDAAGQKKAWIGDHFGYQTKVNAVGSSPDKAAFAQDNTVLIDDRAKSIDPFVAAGGIGILHTSARDTISALKVMMADWE